MILWIIIIDLILFILLLSVVKEIVKEALSEFKAEIIEEFRLKELMNRPPAGSTINDLCIGNSTENAGQVTMDSRENV